MSTSGDADKRLTTGVPGLDTVLAGGFLRRTSVILHGAPGSGKTVLANQIAFHQTNQGTNVLYVTLLTESHTSLLGRLRTLRFFDASAVGDKLIYVSGFRALRERSAALLSMIREELLARRPGFLVVDGLSTIQELYGAPVLRQFLHDLQTSAEAAACTCLLISATAQTPSPEDAAVDTVLFLCEANLGLRTVRELRVNKSRGSAHIHGRHVFHIDENGVSVFPRIEALHRTPSRPIANAQSVARFEQDALDQMLGGGVPTASSTALLGATGTGKTLLGLSFLAGGLQHGEPAMYAGFFEATSRLLASAGGIGLDLQKHADSGRLRMDSQAAVEISLDIWGHRVLESVRTHRPTRLFIDGFNALRDSAAYPERVSAFLTALLNELRALDVTTMMSAELRPIIGPGVDVPVQGLSPMVENTILLRFVELRSHLYRLIAVLKVRGNAHQSALREFRITSQGLYVASTFDSAEAILDGTARPPASGGTDEKR